MIILRKKIFSTTDNTENVTSRDLQLEQMRMQRQLLQTQRLREKIAAQERRDAMKNLQRSQKEDAEEKSSQAKNQINVKKLENDDLGAKNVNLFKTRSKVVAPVPMKV